MKRIKYICFFDSQEVNNQRYYVVAAANKMQYIISVLRDIGYIPQLVSCSWSTRKKLCYVKGFTENRGDYCIRFFPSIGGNGLFTKVIQKFFYKINLFIYLLRHTKKGEIVLAYHSLAYSWSLLFAKKIKKFKLVLEVEEIYQDVVNVMGVVRHGERLIFKNADAFVFSTELLKEKLNKCNKPSVIIYGSYSIPKVLAPKIDDGKIHVVYAGTFDPRKGGCVAASAAKFLPNDYVMHVCGFGNDKQIIDLKNIIEDNNADSTNAHIEYEGLLKGTSYLSFLQSCHIGLSPQDPNASFNATSFPSKILSYLSNGLSVVSIRIEAIERSTISKSIFFYDSQSPQEIAKAIIQASPYSHNIDVIEELDRLFRKDLSAMLNIFHK